MHETLLNEICQPLLKQTLLGAGARGVHLLGENVLQREAERGSQGADQARNVEGELGDGGQQHSSDDGDERHVHLEGAHEEEQRGTPRLSSADMHILHKKTKQTNDVQISGPRNTHSCRLRRRENGGQRPV